MTLSIELPFILMAQYYPQSPSDFVGNPNEFPPIQNLRADPAVQEV